MKQNKIKYSSENPDPIDIEAGARLKFIRSQLGLSQEKLADKLGITFQQVQKYENATNRISMSKLHMICEALGTNPCYFFKKYDGENYIDIIEQSDMAALKHHARLAGKYERLSDQHKLIVKNMINVLLKEQD